MAERRHKRNSTFKNHQLLKPLFVAEHFIISNTEDNLQKAVYKLNPVITEHWLTTPAENTRLVAFKGESQLEVKLNSNTIIEQKKSIIT
jgi:hypothetical protein